MYKIKKHNIILFLVILLLLISVAEIFAQSKDLIIHYIDVGQADSILVELPKNRTLLIDAGNNSDGNMLIDYLEKENIDNIDYLIGTHPHADHIGGLDDIIDNFQIGKIYMPEVIHTTKTFEDVLLAIQRKRKKITPAKAGVNILNENDLKIYFISPIKDEYNNLNHYSAVLKLDYKENSFLFTGDAEIINEKEIIEKYSNQIKSDILKVGHHGSNTSTSSVFLEKVDPDYAIISVGKNNRYNHPSPEIINRLNSRNIKIYRTDQQGTILAKSNGQNITFAIDPVNLNPTNNNNSNVINTGIIIESVDLVDEIVVIKNNGKKEINLTGWKLLSIKGEQEFIFPEGTKLIPGDYIKIVSGAKAVANDDKTIVWTKSYIWNNSGDPAELYDSNNNLVSGY